MGGISVDPVASLDDLKERKGFEPSQVDQCEERENARSGLIEIMRALYEISAQKPIACLVLLDSAIGRLSEKESAKRLRVSYRYVRQMRRWLRDNHPLIAECLRKN